HALMLEGRHIPGIAIGGEWLLPTGPMSAPRSSYSFKALLTKTTSLGRVHLNAGGGTFSVQSAGSNAPGCIPPPTGRRVLLPTSQTVYCQDTSAVRIVTDLPCVAPPGSAEIPECAAEFVGPDQLNVPASNAGSTAGAAAGTGTRTYGRRTFIGIGFDHA